jgi:PKD repeat protein
MRKSIISAIVLLVCIAIVSATPPIPESYWGYATLNGAPAPYGTSITVEVYDTGEEVGNTTVQYPDGGYSLDIIFDDPDIPGDEGANEGDLLTWKINDITCSSPAPGTDTATIGGSNSNFNLIATSEDNPPSITVLHPNGGESIPLGTQVQVSARATDDTAVTSVTFSYSSNGGSDWNSIGAGTRVSGTDKDGIWNRTWNTNGLGAGSNYLIKAVASDGTSPDEDQSDSTFSLTCTPPSTPTLSDPGTTDSDGSYTVSWSSVSGATSYTLEEDTSGSFGSPTVVYSGSGTSKYLTGRSDGTYYYRVKACNACGCSGWSNVEDIEVIPSGNIPPVASFTYSPLNPVVDQTVAFDLSSSYDPDGQITHYRLDFGDESEAEGPGLIETIGHEYSSAGSYIVTLTVTDDYGATGTETKNVIVTLTVGLIGDLNRDGTLTPADAVIALHLAASDGWDPAADMNSDDCITSLDALMILSVTPTTQSSREPPCDSYGDVDDDGYVTIDDYDLVRSYVGGGWDAVKSKTSLTSEEEFKRRADIDGDDKVSFFDSVFIDHYINGTCDTFPLCP